MGRKKTGKKVMSIRVHIENEPFLKKMVSEKDKELKDKNASIEIINKIKEQDYDHNNPNTNPDRNRNNNW